MVLFPRSREPIVGGCVSANRRDINVDFQPEDYSVKNRVSRNYVIRVSGLFSGT
jgi:hypothetical protein